VRGLLEDLVALGDTAVVGPKPQGGTLWWDQTLACIRSSDALLFALTPRTLASEACWRQMRYAHALGKPLFAIELSGRVDMGAVPAPLSSSPFVNYRRRDREAALSLCRALRPLGKARPLQAALPAPAPPPPDLASLRESINTAGKLGAYQQSVLIAELARDSRDHHIGLEARQLLQELRRRRDLTVSAAQDIDALLRKTAATIINLRVPPLPRPAPSGAARPAPSGAARAASRPAPARPRAPARPSFVQALHLPAIARVLALLVALVVAAATSWLVATNVQHDQLEGLHIGSLALTGGELAALLGIGASVFGLLSLMHQLGARRRAIAARGR